MERKFKFSLGEFYHLYNRGVDRQNIFRDESDRQRFVTLLYSANTSTIIHLSNLGRVARQEIFSLPRKDNLVDIGAYCLMPNHFHILVREKIENGISRFMGKLLTGYSMYFNKKNERSGPLLNRPFRATHATDDRHLKYLFSYIHLNPLKLVDPELGEKGIKIKKDSFHFLENFSYSSYQDYKGIARPQKAILSREAFPDYFPERGDFEDELFDWMTKELHQGDPLMWGVLN